ncbi:PTI1-like tyrosine-protein kinase At3g15890 [Helianthus annuus]|uniref:Protein kinase domain-containing protein n=1 Tax=Helianthus annuus TaxID=4232 RepID=A0A251T9V0_HELAN|nr:PTI1-like tyrosine-protein kinase At3g15890 [Helianthus annuus]
MTRSEHQSDSGKFITLIYLRCFNFHLQLYFNKNEKKNKKSGSSTTSKQPSTHVLKIPEIMKATKDLDESLLMRRGRFGDVYYGELLHGSILVPTAIKRYTRRGPTDSWPDVEKQDLYALRHPNLVSLIGYRDDDRYEKETILVYEYISSRKSLNDHLHVLSTPLP